MKLREEILQQAKDLDREPIDLPVDVDQQLYVQEMDERSFEMFRNSQKISNPGGGKDSSVEFSGDALFARLTVRCLVDENGNRIFDRGELDVEALKESKAGLCSKVANKAIEMSGLTNEDIEEAAGK